MASKEKNSLVVNPLTSILSTGNRLDVADHEIDLQAVASHAISIGEIGSSLSAAQKYFILKRINLEGLLSLDDLPTVATFMIEKIENLSEAESVEILKEAIVEHDADVNIPSNDYELFQKLVEMAPQLMEENGVKDKLKIHLGKEEGTEKVHQIGSDSSSNLESAEFLDSVVDWSLQVRLEAALIAYWSPYPEVRSISDPFDDPTIPVETIRVYILGLIWVAIGTFINQFFAMRQPKITLGASVVQLFLYPSGKALEYILPKWKFKVWKYEIDLNPGPWNHKEQMLATIFYSVAGGTSYVSYNIHVQKMSIYYDNKWATFGYQVLLILATNFMGFGFAGIMRKFAIYPIKSIWPTILPTLALNKALMQPERKENINGWTVSKYNFLFITFGCSFLYFWVPNYLFGALSTFNWMTWIAPTNFKLAAITGSVSGLGLNPIPTFDWNIISYNNPLEIPFYSTIMQYFGSLIAFLCIIGIYFTNNLWTGYLPINSASLFTNEGEIYSVRSIIDSKSLFQQDKYEEIGPPYYSAANLVTYGAFFALYPFAIVYEFGTNWKSMLGSLKSLGKSLKNFRKSTYEGYNDPHTKMMSRYSEVPDWVFLVVLVISIVFAILCVKIYPAETPVWGIFFTIGINFIFLIPLVSIYSVTGYSFGLNVLVELIVGYAIPGNGLALNFLKALGYNIDGQAENYITDQKMGHYVKLPPRAMFRCQMLSVFVLSFITLAVINFEITSIKDYCLPSNRQKFTCPDAKVFYNASILWGVIGPKKVFSGLYPVLQYCFLIGFLLAVVCIPIKLYAPRKYTKYFQPTLVIGGMLVFAPYNLSYFTAGVYVSIASMWYLRTYFTTFWQKYNYIFSGAMSAGIAFSGIIMFFAVQYHDKSINWWGNNVMYAGVDGMGTGSRLNASLAEGGYFGLRKGHFP